MAFECANWWLRDPASGSNFANVNNNGNCNANNASNSNGIRPDLGGAYKSSVLGSVSPKGKVIRAERLKDSAETRSRARRFILCGKIRRADIRDLIRKEARFYGIN